MKVLFLTTVLVSSSIISFSTSIAQSAESNVPVCLKTTSTNEEVVFKEHCTKLRTLLKDILGKYEKMMTSKRLIQTTERTKIRNTVWYYTPRNKFDLSQGRMLSTDNDKISVGRSSKDKQFCVNLAEDVMTCIALNPNATFFHNSVPEESVKITGESPKKILTRLQNLQIPLQKLRDELRNP